MPAEGAVELVTLGETLISFTARESVALAELPDFGASLGGAEANVAVGVARLGHTAAYIGRVGEDGFGMAIERRLRGEGVDVSHLHVQPGGWTGLMIRERRTFGPLDVSYRRAGSAGAALSPEDVRDAAALFDGARWLHVTGVTLALSDSARDAVHEAVSLANDRGLTVSLDLNIRRKLWAEEDAARTLADLVPRVDLVLGGLDEAALVAGLARDATPAAASSALVAAGARTAVLKLGADGAMARDAEGGEWHSPAQPVAAPVDPVGAGDGFSAGYIAACLEGADPARALRAGNACGAAVVAAPGDMTGLPTRAELERLLGTGEHEALR